MSNFRWLLVMMIAVAAAPGSLLAQQAATVTGRVTGEGGAPVAAVTVAIPSLGVSTQTGADGTYTLTVPASRVRAGQVPMTAQRVGLQTQTLAVTLTSGGTVTRNFQLGTDVLQLQEIVAIGIGQTTTRERLGTSIASVSGEALTRVQTPNIVTAIAAKAPNVEVTSSSGEPGAATYIRIRGVNTISGSGQPLFVVDGVPINNETIGNSLAGTASANRASDINPNDVASMEILKGAAASAIYGARAGNGVILITTKSGQAGQTRASLTSTITRDQVTQGVPLQTGFGQGVSGAASTSSPFSWGPRLAEGTPTFDHFGEMFRTGNVFDNNLSVSGGSERTTYFLSLGRLDHEGTIVGPNNFYNRTTARLKGTHQLISSLQVGGNFAYAQTDGAYIQKGSNLSGLLLGALRTPPEFDNREFRSETGLHRSYRVQNPTTLASSRGYDNPFFVVNDHRNDSELGRIFGNVNALFTPLSWLSVNYTLGNDYWNDERLTGLPPSSSDYATGRMERGTYTYHEIDSNLTATATHTFSDVIGGSLTLGHNRNSRSFRQHNIFAFDFVAPDVFSLNNTVTRDPDEFRSLIHSESFFGQATTDLFDQLYLTGALRYDGFSTFGESERRHLYPKASAAWEFTKALGIERGEGLLGFGKVRAAWGQAGNEPGVYQTITAFSAGGSFIDGGWGPYQNATFAGRGGLNTSTLRGQEALRPERTTEREVGLDLGLFRDMATVGITYYNALTTDAIFPTPLAPSTGFATQAQNAATIRNEGIELNADVRVLRARNFAWEIGGQFARNNNRVLDLGDEMREFVPMPGAFSGAPGAAVRGERVGVIRGNDFYRCGREDLPANIQTGCAGAAVGAIYVGANGFPLLDPQIRVIADPHPDWTAGIRNNITLFSAVQLSSLIDIKQGGDVWNGTKGALYHFGTHADTERRGTTSTYAAFSGNTVAGPGADKEVTFNQAWFTGLGSGFGPVASQFMEDGSYVKLREIALSYSIPTTLSRRLGMGGIDLRVAGRNLRTWTDYTGIDPETNLAGTTNLRGIDYFNNPQTRSFVFTVGLNR